MLWLLHKQALSDLITDLNSLKILAHAFLNVVAFDKTLFFELIKYLQGQLVAIELLILNGQDPTSRVLYVAVNVTNIRITEEIFEESLCVVGLKMLVETICADFEGFIETPLCQNLL